MLLRDLDRAPLSAPAREPPEARRSGGIKWYVVRSGVLEDRFVLCMRKELYREVTSRFPDTAVYFLPEMEELLALRDEMDREAWRRMVRGVHLVKKTFRGWVVPRKTKRRHNTCRNRSL